MLALSWACFLVAARFIISRGFPRLQILQAYERSGAESKKAEASSRTIDHEQVRRQAGRQAGGQVLQRLQRTVLISIAGPALSAWPPRPRSAHQVNVVHGDAYPPVVLTYLFGILVPAWTFLIAPIRFVKLINNEYDATSLAGPVPRWLTVLEVFRVLG